MTLPDILVEVAFTTDFYAASPAWTDVTAYTMGVESLRGRGSPLDVCDPGTATFVFDNTSGDWDSDRSTGPFYGHLRPMKLIRVSAVVSGTTYRLFTGFIDSLSRSYAGLPTCTVRATDRFKQLARFPITTSRVAENADVRISALLASVTNKTINTNAYAALALVAHDYAGDSILSAAQDAAHSDGGVLFVDSSGTTVFQTAAFRTSNTRATVSQATFGNVSTAIPIEDDLDPAVDDALMANTVSLTDGAGVAYTLNDAAAALVDGDIRLDLGSTMLQNTGTQIADRLARVLALLIDAKPRYQSVTINPLVDAAAASQAVLREISDRITVAFIAPGLTSGVAREQFVESVGHTITLGSQPQWLTTFGLSNLPGAASVGRTAI